MAARLAHARIREVSETPANIVLAHRLTSTVSWRVDAINQGLSLIPGSEPVSTS
jgi:hypothetical protein